MDNQFTLLLCPERDVGYYADGLLGDCNPVYIAMHYTPPYEPFNGLRQFQLQMQQLNPFELRQYQPIIDLTEWLHHEREVYFDILVKYLADHTDLWRCILTVRNASVRDVQPMFLCLRLCMTGEIQAHAFAEQDHQLEAQLISQYGMTEGDARTMAQIILKPAFRPYRSHSFLERVVKEIRDTPDAAPSGSRLKAYALGQNSLLRLIDENAVLAVLGDKEGRSR